MLKYISISFFFIAFNLCGQDLIIQKNADQAFSEFAYKDALSKYQYLYAKDSGNHHVLEQICRSFLKLNDSEMAEKWLGKLIEKSDSLDNDYVFEYAQVLSKNEKYDQAEKWYNLYKENGGSKNVNSKLRGVSNPNQFFTDRGKYSIKKLGVNTPDSDFSPFYYDEGLAFVSSRNKKKWVKESYRWDESDFLDFYYFTFDDTLTLKKIHGLNSKYHEGPAQTFDAGDKIVFTRNNLLGTKLKRSKEGVVNLKLLFAQRDSLDVWGNIVPYSHNTPDFSMGHPTISQDGQHLIFAADLPTGLGGTDLFYSRLLEDNSWSAPVNLGNIVNTSENELFPYIFGSQLWFASNGHEGLGGLDIYHIHLDDFKPTGTLKNIGAPINSSQDDFGLITNGNLREGYFTSDRDGNDDIYAFLAEFITLRGNVLTEGSNIPVSGAEVIVLGHDNIPIANVFTDIDGEYSIEIGKANSITINARKENYILTHPIVKKITPGEGKIALDPIFLHQRILKTSVVEDGTSNTIEDVIQTITDLKDHKILSPDSKDKNQYFIENGKNYEIVMAKEGYYTRRDTLTIDNSFSGIKTYTANLKKIIIGESIKLDHIYYDVNSANLRYESEVELDKVVVFMLDNPHIKIELGSHTDSRGSANYNLKLSQQRAESATNYLVKQSVEKERIIPKGYGENQVMNRCADGVKCTEEEHQENRRTVIRILEN